MKNLETPGKTGRVGGELASLLFCTRVPGGGIVLDLAIKAGQKKRAK